MLFKALISRLNGGTDTASTKASSFHRRLSKVAYEKYPILPSLVLRLLSRSKAVVPESSQGNRASSIANSTFAQRVFPALEIIERSGLPQKHSEEISSAIKRLMESSIWAIREKSAKTFAVVTSDKDLTDELQNLLQSQTVSQNALHGRLICARLMITRQQADLVGTYTKDVV